MKAQYAILRFAKYKGPEIGHIESHNERTKEKYASNPDVDTSRSHLNFHLMMPQRKYRAEAEKQIAEAGCRTRSDSVRVVEALVTASTEFFKGKKKLTQWQDQFWEYMVKKYPDLERGESASKTGRDHIPPRLFKEAVHLNRMKEQILKLMTDTNLLNKKSKMEELEALLNKYVPATEALRTKLRKYDKAYKALSDENSALEAELKTAKDASKERIADRLKYGKTEQELCELHALIDNIPPEIVAAYRRKTTGLQNER